MSDETYSAWIVLPAILLVAAGLAWAGSQGGATAAGMPVFALAVALAFLVNWLAFIPAWLQRTEKFFDLMGGVTFLSATTLAVALTPQRDVRTWLLTCMVSAWALRLSLFLFARIRKAGEDARFRELKVSFARFLVAWTLQGLWAAVTLAAALAAITAPRGGGLDAWAWVGLVVWLFGFVFEVVADVQKSCFKADPANRGQFIRSGLWVWSRHPNYFGEIVLWIGVALVALPTLAGWRWLTLVSPLFVILLLTRVSGIPMLEARADAKWGGQPEYEAYKARTSALIPWWPKKQTERVMRKRRWWQALLVVLALLLVGPFLVPVPPLEGTVPPEELADPDSRFVEINGLRVHYKMTGEGEPVFVLLHGFGASLYSWNSVFAPLGEMGTVIAYDRPAFGLTERPLTWEGENPYSPQTQVDLLLGLLDHFGVERAILVGNSAGGTVAMNFTLQHPDRVWALILVDPAVYAEGGASRALRWLLRTPQMRHLSPLIARQIQTRGPELIELAWYDPSRIPPETLALYKKPLQAENWDRALWELTVASEPSGLADRLSEFTLPVLVVTGDTDRIVPTEQSVRLAGELPDAQLAVIPQAGHVPHEERPDLFLRAVRDFLQTLPER